MKKIVLVAFLFSSSLIFSQPQTVGSPTSSTSYASILLISGNGDGDSSGSIGMFISKPNDIEGDVYAFPNWENIGVIMADKRKFSLPNINLNIKTNNFESKFSKDSVFVFDIANIDHVLINNKKFESFTYLKNGSNRILEIIYDGDDYKMLKGYEVHLKKGKQDPLGIRKAVDKYVTTNTYYLKMGNDINKIRLQKKIILPLFKNKVNSVNSFVKKNNLSYKNEKDLVKMFKYYDTL